MDTEHRTKATRVADPVGAAQQHAAVVDSGPASKPKAADPPRQSRIPPPEAHTSAQGQPASGSSAAGILQDAAARLQEGREYLSFYLSTKSDALKLAIRNVAVYAILGIVGLVAAGAAVVTAVVLLMTGISHGIGAIFGHEYDWLGDLIVGILVLGVIAGDVLFGMSTVTKTSRKKIIEKYETRKRDQRARYGHDVRQRAEQNHG